MLVYNYIIVVIWQEWRRGEMKRISLILLICLLIIANLSSYNSRVVLSNKNEEDDVFEWHSYEGEIAMLDWYEEGKC